MSLNREIVAYYHIVMSVSVGAIASVHVCTSSKTDPKKTIPIMNGQEQELHISARPLSHTYRLH